MFTSEHCMMYTWHPLCHVEMINKPIRGVEKADFEINEE